jgi:hypothetical protein
MVMRLSMVDPVTDAMVGNLFSSLEKVRCVIAGHLEVLPQLKMLDMPIPQKRILLRRIWSDGDHIIHFDR